jgi:outer membrane lipoprotein-sorting protein
VSESGSRLLIDQCERDGGMTRCSIDRSTLTPREYVLKDHSGTSRFSLSLRNYGQLNGIVWPQTIEAVSDSGRILIELRDIEINGELPATAFHPAPRAELLQ